MQRASLQSLAVTSLFSHDPRTRNAARLYDARSGVLGPSGCNQVPFGVAPSDGRVAASEKASYIEHAERAAIYRAAREGFATDGCELIALWAACPDCARAIINAGITAVHTSAATFAATPERWKLTVDRGLAMLDEAGVDIVFHRDLGVTILFNGEEMEL